MIKKILAVILLTVLLLSGCAQHNAVAPEQADKLPAKPKPVPTSPADTVEVIPSDRPHSGSSVIEGQLIALADTQEDAKEIAELYEIQLLSYSNGVALFYTEEDTDAVIARGLANGWPTLSKNSVSHAYSAY